MIRLGLLSTAAFIAGMSATPLSAQDDTDRVNQVIIYGEDECPQSDDNTITVCARMDESERYRIPRNLRESNSPQNESWTVRARSLETVGKFGALSCTPAGAGGELGCTPKFIEAAYQEKAQSNDVRFSQLIEEARAERLAGIDDEAADTQARVEELERAYLEKLERERDGDGVTQEEPLPAIAPQVVSEEDMPAEGVTAPVFGPEGS